MNESGLSDKRQTEKTRPDDQKINKAAQSDQLTGKSGRSDQKTDKAAPSTRRTGMARKIMVQGTMSGVGKSLIAAALCRIFTQDGFTVAPFKSQNMALNSFVTRDGKEMGRAQVLQARAAGKEPDVRMNPILLKPTGDAHSQVIVNGEVFGDYRAADYFKLKTKLVPGIMEAFDGLASENDIIVVEGAGSPAEINLKENDIVNMGLAEMIDAPVILVGDIDPGGVFAQLYGTIALLPEHERKRIIGLVINKFRGDPEILRPGLSMLEDLTGIPVLGVVPYMRLNLDEEDSLAPALERRTAAEAVDIAVIRLPRISNFTDFTPLTLHPELGVRYVSSLRELGNPDLVILPGTKNTMGDLEWLRKTGLEAEIVRLCNTGTSVLGICGGYQMLGETLEGTEEQSEIPASDGDGAVPDSESGVPGGDGAVPDSEPGVPGGDRNVPDSPALDEKTLVRKMAGMGLLPCTTVFAAQKTRLQTKALGAAAPFAGLHISGYQIHMGITDRGSVEPFCILDNGESEGAVCDNVFGTYLHGLFDSGEMTAALANWLLSRKGAGIVQGGYQPENYQDFQEQQLDILADTVRRSLDMEAVYKYMK